MPGLVPGNPHTGLNMTRILLLLTLIRNHFDVKSSTILDADNQPRRQFVITLSPAATAIILLVAGVIGVVGV
jgi:hypothetical protein